MSRDTKVKTASKGSLQKAQDGLHILLIEDEITLINLYQLALERFASVTVASNTEDALTILQSKDVFDIILLDLIIPPSRLEVVGFRDREGFKILDFIRGDKGLGMIPVIVMTNLDSAEDREYARKQNVAKYIVKSNVVPRDIIQFVKEFVG